MAVHRFSGQNSLKRYRVETEVVSLARFCPPPFGIVILAFTLACTGCKSPSGVHVVTTPRPVSLPAGASTDSIALETDSPIIHAANFRIEHAEEQDSETGLGQEVFDAEDSTVGNEQDHGSQVDDPISSSSNSVTTSSAESKTDLHTLIAQALSVHPRIQAARQRVAALNNRGPQVTALDDPVVGNTFWPIHEQALQTAGGRVGHQFRFGQNVPWPEKLKARGALAHREAQVALAEVAKAEREIVESVRLAYYELWLSDRLIEIVRENQVLAGELTAIAEARYKTGGSQQDILRAETQGDKLEDQLIALRRQKEQAQAELGTLVRQSVHWMPTAVDDLDVRDMELDLELLIAEAEQCNPSLQGLAAEIARDRAKQTLACLQRYPDFQLGVGYSIISDDRNVISPVANGHDNLNFSIGVSLPIWRDRINGGLREAAHQRNSTIHLRESERDRLRGQIRRQVAAADASNQQLALFRDRLIPRAEQTLKIAMADYQGKRADFTDLIEIYRELLSYQVQVARAQADLAGTTARLERLVGRVRQ